MSFVVFQHFQIVMDSRSCTGITRSAAFVVLRCEVSFACLFMLVITDDFCLRFYSLTLAPMLLKSAPRVPCNAIGCINLGPSDFSCEDDMDGVSAPRRVSISEPPLLLPIPPDLPRRCGGPDFGILPRINNIKEASSIEFVRGLTTKHQTVNFGSKPAVSVFGYYQFTRFSIIGTRCFRDSNLLKNDPLIHCVCSTQASVCGENENEKLEGADEYACNSVDGVRRVSTTLVFVYGTRRVPTTLLFVYGTRRVPTTLLFVYGTRRVPTTLQKRCHLVFPDRCGMSCRCSGLRPVCE